MNNNKRVFMTSKEFKELLAKRKKNKKYGNKICELDGYEFQSTKEMNYYSALKLLKKAGEIKEFKVKPQFKFLTTYKSDDNRNVTFEKPITYIADFSVTNKNGKVEIIDVKGTKGKTNITQRFKFKRLLMKKVYGINIKIV